MPLGGLAGAAAGLAEQLQAGHNYGTRLQLTCAAGAVGGAYCHAVLRRLGPGSACFLASLPLVALNAWLPLLFSSKTELPTRTCWLLLLMWLGSFKAIGLSLNRGPLAGPWNLAQSIALYVLPLVPTQDSGSGVKKGRLQDACGSGSKMLMSFVANTTLLAAIATLLAAVPLPSIAKHYCYALGLYGFITFIMDGPAALLIALLQLEVVPPFDQPWLATSLGDFWGRRWNNTTSLTLRALIYDPIVERCLVKPPQQQQQQQQQLGAKQPAAQEQLQQQARGREAPAGPVPRAAATPEPEPPSGSPSPPDSPAGPGPLAGPRASIDGAKARHPRTPLRLKLAGMTATFAVSGLMHEVILGYVAGVAYAPGWWFGFFTIQAPLLIAEGLARKRLRARGVRLPRPLAVGWATCVLLLTAYALFFPPIEAKSDVAVRITDAVNSNVADVLAGAKGLAAFWGLGGGSSSSSGRAGPAQVLAATLAGASTGVQ